MDFKSYLEKLRALPDQQKKIILWVVVGILAVVMGFFWVMSAINNLSKIGENVGNIQLPEIETPKTETPASETAGWKTYTNTEYGFEIKYPENSNLKEIATSPAIDIYLDFQINRLQVRISPWTNEEQYKTIDELVFGEREKQNQGKFSVLGTIPQNYTKINAGSAEAIKWDFYHETVGKIGTTLIVLNNGYYYGIIARSDPLDEGYLSEFTEENDKIFGEMLSTFKFIK